MKYLINTLKYLVIVNVALFMSCQKGSEANNDGYSAARKEVENSKLFKTIVNTTWKHEKTVHYYDDGSSNTTYSNAVITFTSECLYDDGIPPIHYYTNFNGHTRLGGWRIENGNEVRFFLAATDYGDYYTGEEVGQYIYNLGTGGKVVRLTDENFTTQDEYGALCHFTRYYGSNGGGGGSSSGGNNDDDDGGYITCTWCKGSGECHGCGGDGLWLGNAEKCDYCNGSGVCEHCNGTGILKY